MRPRWFRVVTATTHDLGNGMTMHGFHMQVAPTPWGPWRVAVEPALAMIWRSFGERLPHLVGIGPVRLRGDGL